MTSDEGSNPFYFRVGRVDNVDIYLFLVAESKSSASLLFCVVRLFLNTFYAQWNSPRPTWKIVSFV
jgi:hypothetical protein